jgi:hypothetical protein
VGCKYNRAKLIQQLLNDYVMKRSIHILLSFALLALLAAGCKKDTTENVSKIFKVPSITLKGSKVVSIPVGGSYTDVGAEYTGEDGQVSLLAASSNNLNATKPGLYFVTYTKTSASGLYETEAVRYIAVTSVNNPVDRSGTYNRPATGVNCFVKKVGNGVYEVTNPGGAAAGVDVVVYFVETALNTFVCPEQPTTAGPFAVIEIVFTDTGSSWKVVNAGYGTATRTFVKQ